MCVCFPIQLILSFWLHFWILTFNDTNKLESPELLVLWHVKPFGVILYWSHFLQAISIQYLLLISYNHYYFKCSECFNITFLLTSECMYLNSFIFVYSSLPISIYLSIYHFISIYMYISKYAGINCLNPIISILVSWHVKPCWVIFCKQLYGFK